MTKKPHWSTREWKARQFVSDDVSWSATVNTAVIEHKAPWKITRDVPLFEGQRYIIGYRILSHTKGRHYQCEVRYAVTTATATAAAMA